MWHIKWHFSLCIQCSVKRYFIIKLNWLLSTNINYPHPSPRVARASYICCKKFVRFSDVYQNTLIYHFPKSLFLPIFKSSYINPFTIYQILSVTIAPHNQNINFVNDLGHPLGNWILKIQKKKVIENRITRICWFVKGTRNPLFHVMCHERSDCNTEFNHPVCTIVILHDAP